MMLEALTELPRRVRETMMGEMCIARMGAGRGVVSPCTD